MFDVEAFCTETNHHAAHLARQRAQRPMASYLTGDETVEKICTNGMARFEQYFPALFAAMNAPAQ